MLEKITSIFELIDSKIHSETLIKIMALASVVLTLIGCVIIVLASIILAFIAGDFLVFCFGVLGAVGMLLGGIGGAILLYGFGDLIDYAKRGAGTPTSAQAPITTAAPVAEVNPTANKLVLPEL